MYVLMCCARHLKMIFETQHSMSVAIFIVALSRVALCAISLDSKWYKPQATTTIGAATVPITVMSKSGRYKNKFKPLYTIYAELADRRHR